MSKKISVKLAILALFLLSAAPLIAVVNLELCTKGQVQYQPKGDCETSSRTCCEGGGTLKPINPGELIPKL